MSDQKRRDSFPNEKEREDPRSLHTAKDVARILSLNPKCVYRLPIPQVRLGPRTIRWKREDVQTFIEEHYGDAA